MGDDEPDTAHADVYLSFGTGVMFHVGHADVDATPNSNLRVQQLATLLHEIAWKFEDSIKTQTREDNQ